MKNLLNDTAFEEITRPYNYFVNEEKNLLVIWDRHYLQWSAKDFWIHMQNIHLYSLKDLKLITVIEEADFPVHDVAFHPSEDVIILATGRYDGWAYYEWNLVVWNYKLNTLKNILEDSREVTSCDFNKSADTITFSLSPVDDLFTRGNLKETIHSIDFPVWKKVKSTDLETLESKDFSFPFLNSPKYLDKASKGLQDIAISHWTKYVKRDKIWDITFIDDKTLVIASNNSSIDILDLNNNTIKTYFFPIKWDCVEVFVEKDSLIINLTNRDLEWNNTNVIFELNLLSWEITQKLLWHHTLSRSNKGIYLARNTNHGDKETKDYILDNSLKIIHKQRLWHYDLFNHYLKIDNADLLYALVWNPNEQSKNKIIYSINPDTFEVKEVFKVDDWEEYHLNSVRGAIFNNILILIWNIYNSSWSKSALLQWIDLSTTKRIWRREVKKNTPGFVDIWNGLFAFGNNDGEVNIINLLTWKDVAKFSVENEKTKCPILSLAYSNGKLAIWTVDGRLYIKDIDEILTKKAKSLFSFFR